MPGRREIILEDAQAFLINFIGANNPLPTKNLAVGMFPFKYLS